MQSALIILGIAVLIIAVDFAYDKLRGLVKNRAAYRLLFDSIAPFSEKLSLSKLLVQTKNVDQGMVSVLFKPLHAAVSSVFF